MKKIIMVLVLVAAAVFYYENTYNITDDIKNDSDYESVIIVEDEEIIVTPPQIDFDETTRQFDNQNDEKLNCKDNEAVCAVDLAVKCTINPSLNFCNKDKLPRFIFMDDEALGRPTKIDYKIVKIHPIDMNTVEIRTKSECDGMWFGLCRGNIIYVVNNSLGEWVVKEIYALETY